MGGEKARGIQALGSTKNNQTPITKIIIAVIRSNTGTLWEVLLCVYIKNKSYLYRVQASVVERFIVVVVVVVPRRLVLIFSDRHGV